MNANSKSHTSSSCASAPARGLCNQPRGGGGPPVGSGLVPARLQVTGAVGGPGPLREAPESPTEALEQGGRVRRGVRPDGWVRAGGPFEGFDHRYRGSGAIVLAAGSTDFSIQETSSHRVRVLTVVDWS